MSRLKRIIGHWPVTDADMAEEIDREHYHAIVTRKLKVVLGKYRPEHNISTADGHYAAHTRALNTGSIGIALDGLGGVYWNARPFNPGPEAFTHEQVDLFCETVAEYCLTYGIPVTRETVLTHAEVQPTLGVWQRGKVDITWLPGMSEPGDPVLVGDELRRRVSIHLRRLQLESSLARSRVRKPRFRAWDRILRLLTWRPVS